MMKYDYIVNNEDLVSNFWDHTYKVTLTAQGITYQVNAAHEQDALDLVMDYNVDHELIGLYNVEEPEFSEDYIQAGNHGYWFNTYNIRIEEIPL
jgi:hypothetical protein